MSYAFQTIPAKPTFGTLRENLYQSDYIKVKRNKLAYCKSNWVYNRIKKPNYYRFINSFNVGPNLATGINKGNLIMGQYTKLNLNHVCTVAVGPPPTEPCSTIFDCYPCQNNEPVTINSCTCHDEPFYYCNTIDPNGELFGASQCGELNYTHYMGFTPLQLTNE